MKSSPSLLSQVIIRFSDQKRKVLQLLQEKDSFRSLCGDYQQCAEALAYWNRATEEVAPLRRQEYSALLRELEQEIVEYLETQNRHEERERRTSWIGKGTSRGPSERG